IKFAIVISQPSQPLMSSAQGALRARLTTILRSAERLRDLSLYTISNPHAEFLILGCVDYVDFNSISRELLEVINESQFPEFFEIRTYTHIMLAGPGELPVSETLPLRGKTAERLTAEQCLLRGESAAIEIKASAFMDVDLWLNKGDLKKLENPDAMGFLKAMVGFLNTAGGTVVIGALEDGRNWGPEASRRLADFPLCGTFRVCGLKFDYQGKDWDLFARRLRDVIRTHVDPWPGSWIAERREIVQEGEVCVISVREPSANWYYLKSKPGEFYIRDGPRTIKIGGTDADNYKAARRRSPGR
ncbi:MAG: AlbA family DNA-binding domain-containing protein, partial [Thermoanaerobaculia bacterium]